MRDSGTAIRNKLYDYIRIADEKKLFAIYNLLENEIETTSEWWKDKKVIAELDKRYQDMESNKDSGFSLEESQASIEKARKKRNGK